MAVSATKADTGITGCSPIIGPSIISAVSRSPTSTTRPSSSTPTRRERASTEALAGRRPAPRVKRKPSRMSRSPTRKDREHRQIAACVGQSWTPGDRGNLQARRIHRQGHRAGARRQSRPRRHRPGGAREKAAGCQCQPQAERSNACQADHQPGQAADRSVATTQNRSGETGAAA